MKREGGYMMSFSHELNSLIFKMTISYFLYLVFFPKKNKLKHLPILVLVFSLNVLLYEYLDHFFHPEMTNYWTQTVSNLLTYIGFGIVFFTIYSIKKSLKNQQELNVLLEEKQKTEMNLLKARVNPHFLFNTLNTIYLNALKKDDKTPDLILKLSDSFRYILHEGQKEKVAIQQELFHIQNYIHLQEERLSDKVQVNFIKNIENQTQEIAPILLIGFIENAFKYVSILKGNNHKIDIEILLKNKELRFFCKNPFNKNALDRISVDWIESGIGIRNTEKRLQLLYPQNHTLEINEDTDFFEIKLTLKL